jgi:hypothetical protein
MTGLKISNPSPQRLDFLSARRLFRQYQSSITGTL